ncbi:S-layer homology domain-containing protein [Clostridiales bacterium COT073_COT-073]|nr:S-layer homology domain-containing protein [Clostridiales bacterium COT073_COT-073]
MSITQKRVCSVLLVFCMLLTSIPGITAQMGTSQDLTISIGEIELKPEEGKVYYKNNELQAITVEDLSMVSGDWDYNVYFNTQANELILNNYQGKDICFSGSKPVNITVKIEGSNKIKDQTQGMGIANLTGGDLVITAESFGISPQLEIIQDYTGNQSIIYGVTAGNLDFPQAGKVSIEGEAKLKISLEHQAAASEATVIGIFGKTVEVKEKADVTISKMKTDFANTTRFSGAGIYAKESLKISTGTNVNINGKDTKKASYALYCEQDKINLDRAEQIIFEWKTVGSEGADSKPAAQYHKKNLRIFEKNPNKIKYGRPDWRTVTVINGQTDRADNEYYEGETVSISAASITVPFKKWTGVAPALFIEGTSENNSTAKFKLPDYGLKIRATYQAFTNTPVFTEGTKEITLPIITGPGIASPSAIYLLSINGNPNKPQDIKKVINVDDFKNNQKTTIDSMEVPGGLYKLAVKIDEIWHESDKFEIEWSGQFAAVPNIEAMYEEEIGEKLIAKAFNINTGEEISKDDLTYQWYRDDQEIHGEVNQQYIIQKADLGKILKVKISNKILPGTVSASTGKIKKGFPQTPAALEEDNVEITHNSITIAEAFWNAHPEYIYHLTKASNDERVGSKENKAGENRVFDNLMPGNVYNLTVQKAENDYYVKSDSSNELKIKTKELLIGTIQFAGELKYGKEIEAKVSNAPVKADSLKYEWQRVKNGMTESLTGTTAKHQITAEDIDAELQVVVTTRNSQYSGQLSHKTAKVAKADGEAAPTLSADDFVVTDSQIGLAVSAQADYEFRLSSTADWKSGSQKLENLMSDTEYQLEIRKKETATQKASNIQILPIKTQKVEVSIRGILRFGETLTAEVSQDIINSGAVSYQWKRGGVDIAGATQKTYVLVKEDINQQISCQVTSGLGVYTKNANGLVEKAEQAAPAKPVLVAKTDTSITVKAEAGHEYKINKAGSNWQMTAVFTGLEPDTEYQIKARKAMTQTHMLSPESEGLTVKTEKNAPKPKENLQPYTPAGNENTEIVKPQPQPKDEKKNSMNQSKDKPKVDEKDMSKEQNTMDKASSFADVKKGEWFEKAVQFVYESELMQGTDTMHFQPNAEITRSQLVTVLHRMAGSPMPKASADFKDVESGSYYQNAVSWAKENEIVSGYGDGLFGAMDNVTREQLAVLLYRLANLTGKDTKMRADLSIFADAGEISAFAKEALSWAKAAGYINGTDSNRLLPQGHASRAQIAVILMRYLQANK